MVNTNSGTLYSKNDFTNASWLQAQAANILAMSPRMTWCFNCLGADELQ